MPWWRPGCLRGWAVALIALMLLPACSKPLFRPHRVSTHADAGSTHVAVTLVAPWDEFIDDLQPKFEMSGARALDMVVPDTLFLDEKTLDTLGFKVKVAPPQTSILETITEKEATGVSRTRSSETTTKTTPGDVSGLKGPDLGPAGRTAAGLPTLAKSLGMDPMLRHWAALALFQEVRLLNRYVQRAALRYDYRPYVVRLQVSMMPAARNEPYDAYATFSFFNEVEGEGSDLAKIAKGPPAQLRTPFLIPLLVTDNLEAAVHSRTVDTVRQFGLALSLLVQGFAASAEAERLLEELKAVLGRDLNSLLTVARLSDNTLRVRLGALSQAEARYAMVPRTHNVTLLLLVAKEYADPPKVAAPGKVHRPRMRVLARTSMVDAERGRELPARDPDEQAEVRYRVLRNRIVPPTAADGPKPGRDEWIRRSRRLLTHVQDNRYDAFLGEIKKAQDEDSKQHGLKWDVEFPDALWVDIVRVMVGSVFHGASFDLPRISPPSLPAQTGILVDDPESNATVRFAGGKGLSGSRMSATLTYTDSSSHTFVAERITATDGGREVVVVFPSLAAQGLKPRSAGSDLAIELSIEGDGWADSGSTELKNLRVLYREKKKEQTDPKFSVSVPAAVVIADKDGKGSLQVQVTMKGANRVLLSVGGAEIVNATADPANAVTRDGLRLAVGKTAVLTLSLQNLDVATPVMISAKNENDVAVDPVTRPARRSP